MSKETGNRLTELRRSNAAGLHDHKPSRSQSRRIAVQEGIDMCADLCQAEGQPELPGKAGRNVGSDLVSVVTEGYKDSLDDVEDPDDKTLALLEEAMEKDEFWDDLDDVWDDLDYYYDYDYNEE